MYGIYAQEERIMNMIIMSAPPAGPVPIRTPGVIHSISPIHKTRISRQRQFLSLRSNSPLSSVKRKKGSSSVGAVALQEQSSAPGVFLQEVKCPQLFSGTTSKTSHFDNQKA